MYICGVKRIISIVGTTGIGKTKLAIGLARALGAEIISCDSRQFFREMPIGTAAPTVAELGLASIFRWRIHILSGSLKSMP